MRELFSEFERVPLKIYAAMDYDATTTKHELVLKECFVMAIHSERREGHVHRIDILLLAATTPGMGFLSAHRRLQNFRRHHPSRGTPMAPIRSL